MGREGGARPPLEGLAAPTGRPAAEAVERVADYAEWQLLVLEDLDQAEDLLDALEVELRARLAALRG